MTNALLYLARQSTNGRKSKLSGFRWNIFLCDINQNFDAKILMMKWAVLAIYSKRDHWKIFCRSLLSRNYDANLGK